MLFIAGLALRGLTAPRSNVVNGLKALATDRIHTYAENKKVKFKGGPVCIQSAFFRVNTH